MDAGLVRGEGFAVDANVTDADASRYHGKAPDEIDWTAPSGSLGQSEGSWQVSTSKLLMRIERRRR
jgi:hypothetical protein